jgi:hypothetical protein
MKAEVSRRRILGPPGRPCRLVVGFHVPLPGSAFAQASPPAEVNAWVVVSPTTA